MGTTALRTVLPPLPVEGVSQKMARLRARANVTNVIFVGSSLVHRQIDPELFDACLEEHGHPLHSFNFGIDGMRFPESFYLLDRLADEPLPALRWVVLESTRLSVKIGEPFRGTARALYWHDAPRTLLVLRVLGQRWVETRKGRNPWKRASRLGAAAGEHLALFAQRQANLGLALELLRARRAQKTLQREKFNGKLFLENERGFLGIDAAIPDAARPRFFAELERLRRQGVPAPIQDFPAEQALAGVVNRLARAGVRVALLLPPDTSDEKVAYNGLPQSRALPVFDYRDPARVPALFEACNRYDTRHLNLRGARLFTTQLATDFAALLGHGE